jgi:DNA-binding MarR family transcriptional regulator
MSMNQQNRAVQSAYGTSLDIAESAVLTEIFCTPNISPSVLAVKLVTDRVVITRILSKLRKSKLVTIETANSDKRQKYLKLTKLGQTKFNEMYKKELEIFGIAESRLKSQELKRLLQLSNKYLLRYENLEIAKLKEDRFLLQSVRVFSRVVGFTSGNLFGQKNVNLMEWHILALLFYTKDQVTAPELANKLSLLPATLTSCLSKLYSQKLINKYSLVNNKKVLHLELTKKGSLKYLELEKQALIFVEELYSPLKNTELEEFVQLLAIYAGNIGLTSELQLTSNILLKQIQKNEDKNEVRVFIYKERVKQAKFDNIPSVCASDNSLIFLVYDKKEILAVYEYDLSRTGAKSELNIIWGSANNNQTKCQSEYKGIVDNIVNLKSNF